VLMSDVTLVLLTDVLFFITENNHSKFHFYSHDNKVTALYSYNTLSYHRRISALKHHLQWG